MKQIQGSLSVGNSEFQRISEGQIILCNNFSKIINHYKSHLCVGVLQNRQIGRFTLIGGLLHLSMYGPCQVKM